MIIPATASRYLERLDRPAQVLLALALALWLSWWAADTFWLMYSGPQDAPMQSPLPVVSAAPTQQSSGLSAERIRSWSLFGAAGAAPVVVSAAESAPDTRLRLELLGLFQSPDNSQAGAIIAEQGKEGDLYRVGAKVPGNATLEEILSDRVILLRAGQREALRLKEPELVGMVDGASSSASGAGSDGRATRVDRRNVSVRPPVTQQMAPANAQSMTDSSGVDPADMEGDLSVQRNIIIQQLGLAPADGEGYRIGPGAPADLLQQVGLRQGDILVSVNGNVLGNEGSDIAALQEFRNTGAATIVVQRGAQRFTVNYPP